MRFIRNTMCTMQAICHEYCIQSMGPVNRMNNVTFHNFYVSLCLGTIFASYAVRYVGNARRLVLYNSGFYRMF